MGFHRQVPRQASRLPPKLIGLPTSHPLGIIQMDWLDLRDSRRQ